MTILIFFAVLVLLILVHEFGHFIVAKKFGIRVDEFGVGFPPKLFGKKYGETEYTINALPIGGFVKIWGEDPTEEHYEGPDSERSFVSKPRLVQAAVLVAGVTMNVILAFVLYVSAFMVGMPTAIDPDKQGVPIVDPHLYITYVLPDSPAAETLKGSDEILAVRSGSEVLNITDANSPAVISEFISVRDGQEVLMDIRRHDEELTVSITPKVGVLTDEPERAAAGFSMSLVGLEQLPLGEAIVQGAVRTYEELINVAVGFGTLVSQMFKGEAELANMAGPIGIAGLVGDAYSLGFIWLMTFTAFISLNLAVINLLPIPALDGGRLVFVLIESVTRRPIKPIIATRINQAGFIALLALMALVTVNDILRIVG